MQKSISKILAFFLAFTTIFMVSCAGKTPQKPHTHNFNQMVKEDKFLKSSANCSDGNVYYFSCECGERGYITFSDYLNLDHDYSAKVETEEYLKKPATCQHGAEYYYSCSMCGVYSYNKTFFSNELGQHSFVNEVPDGEFIKEEATTTSSAVYYKSCSCRQKSDETFTFGEPLRSYSTSEKNALTPTSLTVTLYDTEKGLYGFTFNTTTRPLRPVIQIAKGNTLDNYVEYPLRTEESFSYTTSNSMFTYYISKVEIPMDDSSTYTYKAYDKYADVGTKTATIKTRDLTSSQFSFAHVGDSQEYASKFGTTLSKIVGVNDFIVHTGDVVESSMHEDEWKAMLNSNFNYLSQIPVMAISGNHETTYKNGSNETYKHFNHQIPSQSTNLGYYYSFYYGNAKFIMLNSNRLTGNRLTDDQYYWLINELENNTATWTFVSIHNPLYSAGSYGSDPAKNVIALSLRIQLQSIFAKYGVDVVMQGHDHLISRTVPINEEGNTTTETWEYTDDAAYSINPNGTIYVMSGTAGAQTRNPFSEYEYSYYYYVEGSKPSSWSEFSIDGNVLTVTVKYVDGSKVSTLYQWGIKKTA